MVEHGVVITGSGLICSAGTTVEQCTGNFINGTPFIHEITDKKLFDGYGLHYAGLIKELPSTDATSSLTDTMDRHVLLALNAAREAVRSSGIDFSDPSLRAGILVGTCSGPMLTIESIYEAEITGNISSDSRLFFAKQYYSAALILAEEFGIRGPAFTVTTACSAFTVAAGIASDMIRIGLLDVVLVGGSDAHSPTTQAGFNGLKATCKGDTTAPFSRPAGLNLGEGAGFMVIESKTMAQKRNAKVSGEILGYGLSNDAYHCSAPDPAGKGAATAMQNALTHANIGREMVKYINAHGTGTEANDKAETKAIRRVFADHADVLSVSSLKSVTGHCLGAAGAVELSATLACMKNGYLPPTGHFSEPRDGCTLDYIPQPQRSWENGNIFLKNNFAFGGNNASLVVCDTMTAHQRKPLVPKSTDPVCITSVGMLSPFGVGYSSFCDGVRNSNIAVNEEHGDNGIRVCRVPDYKIAQIDRRIVTKGVDPESEMCIAAASLALSQAGISERHPLRQQLGFVMNIAQGSTWAEQQHIKPLLKNDFKLEQINAFPYIVPNSITGTICRVLSLSGYNATFCNGPGAGLTGLGLSSLSLLNGHAPAILSGSSDFFFDGTRECCVAEGIDCEATRFGDGAVMVLLERLSSALARGGKPLCTIESVSFSNTARGNSSLEIAIADALHSAGITRNQIAQVCGSVSAELKSILQRLVGVADIFDAAFKTGFALCSQPLYNIFAALGTDHFESNNDKNYILAVSSAFHGNNCIMVLKPYF
ncbi:MAG TPA: beta-ketoacyl-[acyl-carrier-protein] synthase family protein [Chitinispirillaceae bacterium]|nr:beta-ketoacyl-[acyl-carrier-protein] synthase family protein [Chitinispirillaceae bacterium]